MSDQIVTVTVQAALFSAVSTTLAQAITMYQQQTFFINAISFVKFIIIAVLTTPPNYLYQRWLEDTFPSRPSTKPSKEKTDDPQDSAAAAAPLSIPNTIAKFLLEQSLGAAANTVVFIVLASLLNGHGVTTAAADVERNFVSMLTAGWRVWPAVTLLNLVVVPFEYRMLVGNTVGVMWGVYMNLKTL